MINTRLQQYLNDGFLDLEDFNSVEACDELMHHANELAQGYTPPLQLTQYECSKSPQAYAIHTINKNAHYPEKNSLQRDLIVLKGFN